MRNILQTTTFRFSDGDLLILTFDRAAAMTNAKILLTARNPMVYLGRFSHEVVDLAGNGLSNPIALTDQKNAKQYTVDTLNLMLSPAMARLIVRFNTHSAVESVQQLSDVERLLVMNPGSSILSPAVARAVSSILGADFNNLLDKEIPYAVPIPLSEAIWPVNSPFSFLRDTFNKQESGSYYGKDITESGTPGCDVIWPTSFPTFNETDLVASGDLTFAQCLIAMKRLVSAPSKVTDAYLKFKNTKDGYDVSGFSDPADYQFWLEGVLAFVVDCNDPARLTAAYKQAVIKAEALYVNDVLMPAQVSVMASNRAAAAIVLYYCLSPYISRLKGLRDFINTPYVTQILKSQGYDWTTNDLTNGMLDLIDRWTSPNHISLTESGLNVSTVVVGDQNRAVDLKVSATNFDEYLSTPSAFIKLVGPGGVLSLCADLFRSLSTGSVNHEVLLSIADSLGTHDSSPNNTFYVQPRTSEAINVGDGERFTSGVTNLGDMLGRPNLTLSQANDMKTTVSLYGPQPQITFWARYFGFDGLTMGENEFLFSDYLANLIKSGFSSSVQNSFFVRKVGYNLAFAKLLKWAPLANVGTLEDVGLPGPDDEMIVVDSVGQLLNAIGLTFASEESLMLRPFSNRVIYVDKKGQIQLKSKTIIKGPSARRFLESSLVMLIPFQRSMSARILSVQTGFIDNISLVPGYLAADLTNTKELLTSVRQMRVSDIDGMLSKVYPSDDPESYVRK